MSWPGEQLLIRLWETLAEKGIGSMLKPWQIKREGLAQIEVRRAEMLALAQAAKEISEISAGTKQLEDFSQGLQFAEKGGAGAGGLKEVGAASGLPLLVKAIGRQTLADAARKEIAVAKAIAFAEEDLLSDTTAASDQKIEADWLFRWRDHAGEVSAEVMQKLWGKVLAGEFKAPGTFSLRLLDFLRNLSQEEAKLISNLSRFVIGDPGKVIWRDDLHSFEEEGLGFSKLLELQDLGVISGVEALSLQWTWTAGAGSKSFSLGLKSNGKVLVVSHPDPTRKLTLNAYSLTTIGQQLVRLGKFEPNISYLEGLGRHIVRHGFTVNIGDLVQSSDTSITVVNERPIVAMGSDAGEV